MKIKSYAEGKWHEASGSGTDVFNAVTGEKVGEVSSEGLDFREMLAYGRRVGGNNLRKMTFHERAIMLKEIAKYLLARKDELYAISAWTGATKVDSWIDLDGGFGTFFVYSGKGRREMPNDIVYVDGPMEPLSKGGTFVGRHICVPMRGCAVHINAFNFPCWGMMEKLAPTFLAGMPAIVKPASLTCYLTEAVVRMMLESKLLPDGALQLICGSTGDLFDHLTSQDVVTFTGSASTGRKLKSHPRIVDHAIRFNMEADSLNCSILGPDATPGTAEFDLYVKEVVKEMTVKAGQKCTAIRRTIVPRELAGDVTSALKTRLEKIQVGDPAVEGVRMGPLAGRPQTREVSGRVTELCKVAELIYGSEKSFEVVGGNREKGAFFPAMLLRCDDPLETPAAHEIEAFGPVSTIMPYDSLDDAIALAAMGQGSLCGSVFTADDRIARELAIGMGADHGRLMFINEHSGKESTGHGSPLPHLVHGGPGRAGGGEEMGGIRGVMHFMQRVALQGSPTTLAHITGEWMPGAARPESQVHLFRKYFEELEIGDTVTTHRRTVTEADIVNFAGVSGDYFYAHMDEIAAGASELFERRVAHGYFVLAAAAGLFVDPGAGPVLANYGLENLRFVKPVYPGDTIRVKLTVKRKTARAPKEGETPQGTVEWNVDVTNQDEELVANYTLLTLVARKEA